MPISTEVITGIYLPLELNRLHLSMSVLQKIFGMTLGPAQEEINPEKPDVPINKNDAFQKVQKRRVQEKR